MICCGDRGRDWRFLDNPENDSQWMSGILEARQTSQGSRGPGTADQYTMQLFGRRLETASVVTEYEPNRKFSWKATSGPFPMKGGSTFEAVEAGRRVAQFIEGEPGGFFSLAEPLVVRMYRRQMQSDLLNLKEILEAGG